MGKVQKALGILLMIGGIAVCVGLIVYGWQHSYAMWITNDSRKAELFASFREFYWASAGSSIAVAIGIGGIMSAVGYLLYQEAPQQKAPWEKK